MTNIRVDKGGFRASPKLTLTLRSPDASATIALKQGGLEPLLAQLKHALNEVGDEQRKKERKKKKKKKERKEGKSRKI